MSLNLYRAIVKDNKDPQKMGQVRLFIPQIHSTANDSTDLAIWAMPCNSPFSGDPTGGSNVNCGSVLIPPLNTEVFCFFEGGSPDKCYYLAGPAYENKNCLPSEAKVGSEYEKNYVLLKSPKGRAIIISDDSSNQSVVIKGKASGAGGLVGSSDMAIILSESGSGTITIQTGKGKQHIELNKGDGSITLMANAGNYIKISPDGITLKGTNINLN